MATITEAAAIVATLVLLEMVMAFDNAAILTVLSRRLPDVAARRRALNYGLAVAYGLRVATILAASLLIQYEAFLTIGGLYLVAIAIKHVASIARGKEDHQVEVRDPFLARFGLAAFTAIVVEIAVVDLVFAIDAVVAAVSFTNDLWLIVVAAGFGLISLRVLAGYIGKVMDWLPLLEHMAYVAVGMVGAILVLEHPLLLDHAVVHVPNDVKMVLTASLFAVPVAVKLVFGVPASRPGLHAAEEADFDLHPAHRGEDVGAQQGPPPADVAPPRPPS